jgi:hypothetical protein
MDTKIPYEDREDEIRQALVKMAKRRKKLDYTEFGELVGVPTDRGIQSWIKSVSRKEPRVALISHI